MGLLEHSAKALHSLADAMKAQPIALALIVINLLFLGTAVLVLRDVALNAREREISDSKLLSQILRDCAVKKPDSNRGE
jgi:hypothetical protein